MYSCLRIPIFDVVAIKLFSLFSGQDGLLYLFIYIYIFCFCLDKIKSKKN